MLGMDELLALLERRAAAAAAAGVEVRALAVRARARATRHKACAGVCE